MLPNCKSNMTLVGTSQISSHVYLLILLLFRIQTRAVTLHRWYFALAIRLRLSISYTNSTACRLRRPVRTGAGHWSWEDWMNECPIDQETCSGDSDWFLHQNRNPNRLLCHRFGFKQLWSLERQIKLTKLAAATLIPILTLLNYHRQ